MASKRVSGTFWLSIGLMLIAAGLLFVGIKSSGSVASWLAQFWPFFLLLAGVIRIIGFAGWRRPSKPLGGMLLILIGAVILAARANEGMSIVELYGRYWPTLLLLYGGIELITFYSDKRTDLRPPRVFSPLRVIIVIFIITTGVIANRVAGRLIRISAVHILQTIGPRAAAAANLRM